MPRHHTTFFFIFFGQYSQCVGVEKDKISSCEIQDEKHYNYKCQPYVNTTTIIILVILVANDAYHYSGGSFSIVTLGWMIFIC
jgi:hypothetical protein